MGHSTLLHAIYTAGAGLLGIGTYYLATSSSEKPSESTQAPDEGCW